MRSVPHEYSKRCRPHTRRDSPHVSQVLSPTDTVRERTEADATLHSRQARTSATCVQLYPAHRRQHGCRLSVAMSGGPKCFTSTTTARSESRNGRGRPDASEPDSKNASGKTSRGGQRICDAFGLLSNFPVLVRNVVVVIRLSNLGCIWAPLKFPVLVRLSALVPGRRGVRGRAPLLRRKSRTHGVSGARTSHRRRSLFRSAFPHPSCPIPSSLALPLPRPTWPASRWSQRGSINVNVCVYTEL